MGNEWYENRARDFVMPGLITDPIRLKLFLHRVGDGYDIGSLDEETTSTSDIRFSVNRIPKRRTEHGLRYLVREWSEDGVIGCKDVLSFGPFGYAQSMEKLYEEAQNSLRKIGEHISRAYGDKVRYEGGVNLVENKRTPENLSAEF